VPEGLDRIETKNDAPRRRIERAAYDLAVFVSYEGQESLDMERMATATEWDDLPRCEGGGRRMTPYDVQRMERVRLRTTETDHAGSFCRRYWGRSACEADARGTSWRKRIRTADDCRLETKVIAEEPRPRNPSLSPGRLDENSRAKFNIGVGIGSKVRWPAMERDHATEYPHATPCDAGPAWSLEVSSLRELRE